MPALSLLQLAQRAAARSQEQVRYEAASPALWNIAYSKLEPVLKRIEDPNQLHEIEENTEHIAENTGPLWQAFIKRDVTNGESKMLYPKDPKNWHKVYRKMTRQEEREKLEAEENLKKAMMGISEAKSEKKTVFVDKNLLSKGKPKEFVDGVRHTRGQPEYRTRPGGAKEDPLARIRKASALAARNKTFKPMYSKASVPSPSSQIKVAPRSMILEHQKPDSVAALQAAAAQQRLHERAPPKSQISKVFAPQTGQNRTDKAVQEARWAEMKKREARLKAFTAPGTATARSPMNSPPRTTPTAARPPPTPAGSLRQATTATPQRRVPAAPSESSASNARPADPPAALPPSPPRTASPQKAASPAPALLKRKRPTADPFMPTKKGRH